MEVAADIVKLIVAAAAALGIREAWPYLYKYLKGKQDQPAAVRRMDAKERAEYSEGWRGVAERNRDDLNTLKEERKADREEINTLRKEIGKCERRHARRAGLLGRAIDRIRELSADLEAAGVHVRPWTLDESEVERALGDEPTPDPDAGDDRGED